MFNRLVENKVLASQKSEITEYFVYRNLARIMKNPSNKEVLERISNEELSHYLTWREYTGREVKPNRFKIMFYTIILRVFGITFGIKLMERGEKVAQSIYREISKLIPKAGEIEEEEKIHEMELIRLIEEERLQYIGSIILGLNDALIELVGALTGFTLAIQNAKLISIIGLITGVPASLSMAASEYLSKKAEGGGKPLKSAAYTGATYILTVLLLISPYFIFSNAYICLSITVLISILLILTFTFYVSVAKEFPFKRRLLEMALITLGIVFLSFLVGFLCRKIFGIEV
ncbi:MAG: rubrerythrin family protein [Candidatus Methanomethylicia archaeon]